MRGWLGWPSAGKCGIFSGSTGQNVQVKEVPEKSLAFIPFWGKSLEVSPEE